MMDTTSDTLGESEIACRMDALTPAQRERRSDLQNRLHAAKIEARELADGYAFRLRAEEPDIIKTAAEFISLERLCCSFFRFELIVEANSDVLWLRITGREGAKEFIQAELAL